MERIRKRGTRRPARQALTGLLLAALLLGLFPALAGAVDLTQKGYVTVAPGGTEVIEELKGASLVLDVYKVAAAAEVPGYDTYSFAAADGFTSLAETMADPEIDRDGWNTVAAAALALVRNTEITPLLSVNADAATGLFALHGMDAGLYLLVARGADMTKDQYLTVIDVEGEDGTVEKKLVSVCRTGGVEYDFAPMLLALPTKAANEDGEIMTSNEGEWLFGTEKEPLTVVLKPTRADLFGSLVITKTLEDLELKEGEAFRPVTFVFDILIPGENEGDDPLYSNVVSITIDKESEVTGTAVLHRLPVGKEAIVTETYSGADYAPGSTGPVLRAVILPEGATGENGSPLIAGVAFTNRYDGRGKDGHGILNDFTWGENGWTSHQLNLDNAPADGQTTK